MRARHLDRETLLQAERTRVRPSPHGRIRVGVGYPNTYHVAQSSLAFQWVVELTSRIPDIGVERFFADPACFGTTLDSDTPLAELDVLAWSCSFELDAVNLLRVLDASGIPRRSDQRTHRHPLVVLGGAVATINPLPLTPVIDVFCMGAAELTWTPLVEQVRDGVDRDRLLEELAGRDGYLVPRHHLDHTGLPLRQLRRLDRRELATSPPEAVPASFCVTPHTEYSNRALVEISRGCPERCRFCWVSHSEGRFRCYTSAAVGERLSQLAQLTRRVGLVATAVGDHPDLPILLEQCGRLNLDVALSSLRIPAVVPEILNPLAACGARSVTIAPETGSDRLRQRLGKSISNDEVLRAIETARACGMNRIKMYFLVGLPEECDDDLVAIARLLQQAQRIMAAGRPVGSVRATVNTFVPKPYTPYHREPMLEHREWRRRLDLILRELREDPNLRLDRGSHREAVWQGYLSRGDASAFTLLAQAASGLALGRLLAENREEIRRVALSRWEDDAVWHFVVPAASSKGLEVLGSSTTPSFLFPKP